MKAGWVVVWGGRSCDAYLDKNDEWSFDPDEARIYRSWFSAKRAALRANSTGVRVARCWFDEEAING